MFDVDGRYYNWNGNRGFPPLAVGPPGSGWQYYVPMGLQVTANPNSNFKLEIGARTGYASSQQNTLGQQGSLSTWLDTSLSTTATYLGINGIQPFVSLNFNLPTGKSALFGREILARQDPDLVAVSTFGEGFNVGPTVGANIPISQSFIATVAVGYTYRGSYDKDSLANAATFTPFLGPTAVFSPGDIFSANVGLSYAQSNWTVQVTGQIMLESKSQAAGILATGGAGTFYSGDLFKTGDRYILSGTGTYAWTTFWTSVLTASWTHINHNDVLLANLPPLIAELFNSNNNVVVASLENKFVIGSWTLGPTAGYFYRDNNSWAPTNGQFVSAKSRWSAGGLLFYNFTSKAAIMARAEHIWTSQDMNLGLGLPDVTSRGWLVSLGGNVTF